MLLRHSHIFDHIYIAIFIVSIIFLIQCVNKNQKKSDTIIYWSSNNPHEIEFAKVITREWNKNNFEMPVKFQPVPEGRSSEEIILAAVVGKTTPDIYSNMWQGDVEFYAQANVLVPLDTLPGFLEFIYQRCDSAVIAEITALDGHIYQIPWKTNPIMLVYSVNAFKEIGYNDPPKKYSEYLDAAKKYQKDRDGDGYVDRWIGNASPLVTWYQRFFDFYPLYLAASGGGKLIENNEVAFNNEFAEQTFRFLQTLYDKNYFAREQLDARQDAFIYGDIATRFVGPWDIVHFEKFKQPGFEYNFTSVPVPDQYNGPVYTYGDPKNIVIFNTCDKPKLAWEFLKYMINKENDLRFLKITTQLPRRKNLFEDPFYQDYFEKNPRMIPFAKQVKYVRGTDSSPVLKEVFDVISQEYEACVIYGVKSPRQAIEDAAAAASVLLY